MPEIQCPRCGYSALSIATRCPRCGQAFESRLWQSPVSGSKRRPMPVGLVIILGALVLLVVSVVQRERPERPIVPILSPPASTIDPATPALPPDDSTLPADTAPAAAATDSTLDTAIVAPPMLPSAPPPPLTGPTELLYATTWVNVRAGRSGTAAVVRILKPGDAVRVDSLARGWYRVLENGQPLGYLDRSLVGPAPP